MNEARQAASQVTGSRHLALPRLACRHLLMQVLQVRHAQHRLLLKGLVALYRVQERAPAKVELAPLCRTEPNGQRGSGGWHAHQGRQAQGSQQALQTGVQGCLLSS